MGSREWKGQSIVHQISHQVFGHIFKLVYFIKYINNKNCAVEKSEVSEK
jgi:hypothetical protein